MQIGGAYRSGITESVISEVIAHPDEQERKALFELFKRLLRSGNCLMPFNWIIEEQAKAYQADPVAYDWTRLNIRCAPAEVEISRQKFVHSISDETRGSQRAWEKQFVQIFRDAKPAFQAIFDAETTRPSLHAVTERLLAPGGAHLAIGAGLVERATGTCPSEDETKNFVDRCPPFKALLVALCFAQYDRCIRAEGEPSLGKAGRVDMFSAVYLAYCRVFVTNDEGQCRALKSVAQLMGVDVSLQLYADFKADLFGLQWTGDQ